MNAFRAVGAMSLALVWWLFVVGTAYFCWMALWAKDERVAREFSGDRAGSMVASVLCGFVVCALMLLFIGVVQP